MIFLSSPFYLRHGAAAEFVCFSCCPAMADSDKACVPLAF
jgi:hypothetical protein